MRDRKRINKILEILKEYWGLYPDMRLGQIISNIAIDVGASDVYYIEDNILENEMKKQLKKSTIKEIEDL